MNELIQAATRALNAVAAYYENKTLPGKPDTATPPALLGMLKAADADCKQTAEVKTRKARTPKEEKPPVNPAGTNDSGHAGENVPAPVVMTEKDSEERLKVVGEAFVQRFSKSGDAVDEVKKTIESRFKVTRLRDLVHAQRVELLGVLEARIKEIDSRQTQAAAPVAGGLGI